MTEEKESAEEAEEVEEIEDTLDEGQEEEQSGDEAVEGEEEQAAEPVDERGVPLKNVIAELKRKQAASDVREDSYKELLTKLNQGTKKEQEAATDVLKSFSHADFAKLNIDADTADGLLAAFNREIDIRIAGADQQNKRNNTSNQEYQRLQLESIKDAQATLSDEFGDLIVSDGNGFKYDTSSPIFKRAKEIFDNSPKLRSQVDGVAVAAYRAENELIREKYGKGKTKKSSKAEKMKGSSSGRTGGDAKSVKKGGKFHRKLDDSEYDKLSREEKDAYGVWETIQRNK